MSIENHLQSGLVLAGDCRDALRFLPDASVAACLTDPPYNYEFIGHRWNADEAQRRIERVKDSRTLVKNIPYGSGLAGGVRNAAWYDRVRTNIMDYEAWCYEWAVQLFRVCKPGAVVAAFNSTRTVAHVQVALERAGFYARDMLVYRRSSGIPKGLNFAAKLRKIGDTDADRWDGWHSCLRGEWEAVAVLQKPLVNNYVETVRQFGTGLFYTQREDGGFQSNILDDTPREQGEDFNVHCTVKPLALMTRLVEMFAPPGEHNLVLDPFAGSGTTLLAAHRLGRGYIGIEIVPEYLEIIEERLQRAGATCERRSIDQLEKPPRVPQGKPVDCTR